MHKWGEESLRFSFTKANTGQIDVKIVAPSNDHSTFCLYEFDHSKCFI